MNQDVTAIRMMVRLREDFQAMRKRMDNRIGRKADGTEQNIEEREFIPEDLIMFAGFADVAKSQEMEIEKNLKSMLKRFPVYNKWMKDVKGVGPIAAGWILGEFDIHEATTVSKMWQFAGLNPSMVEGKKRIENEDGTFSYIPTGKMIRGDKMTPGFVAPFNKRLRTALVGVLADGFIKAGFNWTACTEEQFNQLPEEYRSRREKNKIKDVPCQLSFSSPYTKLYFNYKQRLEHSENQTTAISKKGADPASIKWKDCSKGHRDRAAKRYMIKMFLKDLYAEWRKIEGLPVREPYQDEYLGHKHNK